MTKLQTVLQIGSPRPGDIKYKDQLTVDTDGDGILIKGMVELMEMTGWFWEIRFLELNMVLI